MFHKCFPPLSRQPECEPHLSGVDRYFCFSKRFSRPISCSSVNTVRLRRPFLLLLPPSLLCSSFPRRCRSSGRWWEAAPTAGDSSGEPSEQDSGEMGNLRRLPWSAFRTEQQGDTQSVREEVAFKKRLCAPFTRQMVMFICFF